MHKLFLLSACIFVGVLSGTPAQPQKAPRFNVLVLADTGGGHVLFSAAGKVWLNKLATDSNFAMDFIITPNIITKEMLAKYQLFLQLDYPPYPWNSTAQAAFEDYIDSGRGSWIGFHHPTLLGVFDGYPMWEWFSDFMGDIAFKKHIPGGTTAMLNVEDSLHPAMRNVASQFITKDEWYIYNKSPRPNVHVLASIDENTYNPAKEVKMGDHPVIWTNLRKKARNIYIAMGHFPELFNDDAFTTIFRNAIFWSLGK